MVATVKRTVRIKTEQHVLPDLPPVDEFPMRQWSIEIMLLDQDGNEIPATLFEKVVYHLHPTFANPHRTFTEQPFRIEEQGWGGFPLHISLFLLEKGGERKITHDLNFLKESYQVDHVIQVPTNKPGLVAELNKSGSVEVAAPAPKRKAVSDENANTAGDTEPKSKKAKTNAAAASGSNSSTVKGDVDLEKLAFGLTKLKEDDLVGIVQMVTDNRTPEMDVTNNIDEGEFTIDLFTLPEGLLKSLWEYVKKNTE